MLGDGNGFVYISLKTVVIIGECVVYILSAPAWECQSGAAVYTFSWIESALRLVFFLCCFVVAPHVSVLVERRPHATAVARCQCMRIASTTSTALRDCLFVWVFDMLAYMYVYIVSQRLDAVYVFSKRPKSTLTANAAHNANRWARSRCVYRIV